MFLKIMAIFLLLCGLGAAAYIIYLQFKPKCKWFDTQCGDGCMIQICKLNDKIEKHRCDPRKSCPKIECGWVDFRCNPQTNKMIQHYKCGSDFTVNTQVSWKEPTKGILPITGYKWRTIKKDDADKNGIDDYSLKWTPDWTSTDDNKAIVDIVPGLDYYFQVRASNLAGDGEIFTYIINTQQEIEDIKPDWGDKSSKNLCVIIDLKQPFLDAPNIIPYNSQLKNANDVMIDVYYEIPNDPNNYGIHFDHTGKTTVSADGKQLKICGFTVPDGWSSYGLKKGDSYNMVDGAKVELMVSMLDEENLSKSVSKSKFFVVGK